MGIMPSLEEFTIYLTDELGIQISSSSKARFSLLTRHFQDKDFTRENLRLLFHDLRTRECPLKKQTLNKYLATVRHIAHYMGNHEFDTFPGYRIKENETKPLGELLSDGEMRKIAECRLDRIRNGHEVQRRFDCAFQLMRFSGIPPIDLTSLTWDNDMRTHLEYYRHKTGKHMLVPLPHQVRHLLDKLPRLPHGYIFGSKWGKLKRQTLEKELKLRCLKLGYKKRITLYSFRYSMITACLITGGEGMMPKIAKIAGHSMDTAMKHYVKFDAQVLIDALYATHPGLISKAPIDIIKRTVIKLLERLVDVNKYQVDLTITPKKDKERRIILS